MRDNTHDACTESWWSTGKLSIGDIPKAPRACTLTPTWTRRRQPHKANPPVRFPADFLEHSSVRKKCLCLFYFSEHNFLHICLWNQLCKNLPNNKSLEWILKKMSQWRARRAELNLRQEKQPSALFHWSEIRTTVDQFPSRAKIHII